MENSKYYIVGVRPIKAVMNSQGGLGIYAFNWDTRKFEINFRYLDHIYGFYKGDVDINETTKEEFDRYVEQLRTEKGRM